VYQCATPVRGVSVPADVVRTACGGSDGRDGSNVTNETTTTSDPASWMLICSGVPSADEQGLGVPVRDARVESANTRLSVNKHTRVCEHAIGHTPTRRAFLFQRQCTLRRASHEVKQERRVMQGDVCCCSTLECVKWSERRRWRDVTRRTAAHTPRVVVERVRGLCWHRA
jgi:hypothetical protein